MKYIDRAGEFYQTLASSTPGFLTLLDFADFKRYNVHLGFDQGDRAIKEFDQILHNTFLAGYYQRIAGNVWLAFTAPEPDALLAGVIAGYARTLPVSIGWRCTAVREEEIRKAIVAHQTFLYRAIRCLYSPLDNAESIESVAETLESQVWQYPVNQAWRLGSPVINSGRKWQCVEYPNEKYSCPCCGETDIPWEGDGCSGVFGVWGQCPRCDAKLTIEDYLEVYGD